MAQLLPFLPSRGSSSGGNSGGCGPENVARLAEQLQVEQETVAAACGDAAGVVTVTDSYVLGASNAMLLPLLQQLASGQEDASRQPLLVVLGSNVTVASRAWGQAWPAGGVVLRRPVAWVGSSSRPTSVDFGMEARQVGGWAVKTRERRCACASNKTSAPNQHALSEGNLNPLHLSCE